MPWTDLLLINKQLGSQYAKAQARQYASVLNQLEGVKFLLLVCQGLALRGHKEVGGNLPRLLATWAGSCSIIKSWLNEGIKVYVP